MRAFKLEELTKGRWGLPEHIVHDEVEDSDYQWITHVVVFRYEDKYYQLYYVYDDAEDTYTIDLAEDWYNEEDGTLNCDEVEQREVVRKEWFVINSED